MEAEAAATEIAPEAAPVDAADAPLEGDAVETEAPAPELDWSSTTTVKVDGEEREVSLDELRKNYELRRSSHKRMEEAAGLRKQIAAKESELREIARGLRDPQVLADAIEQLGHNPETLIEMLKQRAAVPPEEKRARELEAREKRIAQQEAEFQKRIDDQKMSAAVAREQERLTNEFNTALDAHGLNGHVAAIERMAAIMETAIDAGYEMTADEAAAAAVEEMRSTSARSLKGLSAAQLRSLLGDEAVEALRRESLEQVKRPAGRPDANPKPKAQPGPERRKRIPVGLLPDNFFDS